MALMQYFDQSKKEFPNPALTTVAPSAVIHAANDCVQSQTHQTVDGQHCSSLSLYSFFSDHCSHMALYTWWP